MAKQQGALRFVGRFANAVGYKARDGKGDGFDALRAHVATVANPQTLAQMSQRMKLTPVQNFYRGLQGLLNHSWQGVKYKNPSRLHFYSQAMRALSTYGVPYVPKGDRTFVPWSFPVSSGSIAVDTKATSVDGAGAAFGMLYGGTAITWGEYSQGLIDTNPGLKNGDQLTLLIVISTPDGNFIPLYNRINVDIASDSSVADAQQGNTVYIAGDEIMVQSLGQNNVAAAAIIVSRLENSVWQRSNSVMAVTPAIKSLYNSSNAFNTMLESYRKQNNSSSDWYLNDGTPSEADVQAASIKTGSIALDGGSVSFAYYNINGSKVVPFEDVTQSMVVSSYLFNRIDATTIARSGSTSISESSFDTFRSAGYTMVAIATFQATYPEITVQDADPIRP